MKISNTMVLVLVIAGVAGGAYLLMPATKGKNSKPVARPGTKGAANSLQDQLISMGGQWLGNELKGALSGTTNVPTGSTGYLNPGNSSSGDQSSADTIVDNTAFVDDTADSQAWS